MPNANYGGLATTTIESRSRKLADNVSNSNALLMKLKKRGNVRPVSGGSKILQELDYIETTNDGWYSGLDTLTTAAVDTFTAAEFTIKECYASVMISGLEMAQNRSKEKFIDLLASRIKNAERTMINLIAVGVHSDGTAASGKQIGGTQLLISATPTTGTVGGINRATDTFWRNQYARSSVDYGAAMTSANCLSQMGRMYNTLVRGTDKPDLISADNNGYQLFTDAMTDRQVVVSSEMAEAGFTTLKFRGADVVLDGGIGGAAPANQMEFINTDYLHFRPMEGYDMVTLGSAEREPVNQDAIIKIMGWKGNLTLSGAKFQGRLRVD